MNKLTVRYDAIEGHAVADGLAESYVDALIEGLSYEAVSVTVGSDLIVAHIRLAIGEGRLNAENVFFEFKDQVIKFGSLGSIVYPNIWPEGFCDYSLKVIAKICKLKRAKP